MNLAEDSNQSQPRQSVFDYSCPVTQWSQVTPQYMPWGHSPTSPAAPLVTFSAQPQPQMAEMSFSHTLNDVTSQPSTSSFGHKSLMHCKRKADLDIPITETRSDQLPPGDVEDSTARQKRLYVCEEMRRLQTESILPSAILGRLERPCMAVMLWQPPTKIPELIRTSSGTRSPQPNHLARTPPGEDENDNNASTADLNHMDMEQ
ncbi:hypothetical protein CBL_02169 [Carabus blaptoides fortunei]